MNINRNINRTFSFVFIDKDNNYYDLSYEIKDLEIKDLDDDIKIFIDDYLL
jgi:hypothetical protein